MHTLSAPPTSAPVASTFRIWKPPENDTDQLIGSMTLRQVFQRHRRSGLVADNRSKDTIADYDRAVNRWEEFTTTDESAGNYVVDLIEQPVLDQFRSAVADAVAAGDYSAATANKWFRYLRTLLGHLGPRTKKNRRALRYWMDIPFLDPLPELPPDPVHLSDDQLNAIYEHTKVATWPPPKRTGVSAPTWWKVSLVTLFNCAMRRDDWLWLPSTAIDWTEGTMTYVAKKTKKVHCLVMNDVLRAHLMMIFQARPFIFSPTQAHMQLYRQWHEIQQAAKVTAPDGRPCGFHALRQTAADRFHESFTGTAELLLGHALPSNMRVTAKHYLGKKLLTPLWHAMRNIHQPDAFTVGAIVRKSS